MLPSNRRTTLGALALGGLAITAGVGFGAWYRQQTAAQEAQKITLWRRLMLQEWLQINRPLLPPHHQSATTPKKNTAANTVGKEAAFTYRLADHAIHTADNQKNLQPQQVLLNFWASWCPPCVVELPLLSSFYTQQIAINPNFLQIGIAVDKLDAAQNFLRAHPITFPAVWAKDTSALDWQTQLGNASGGLPFTVLLRQPEKSSEIVLYRKTGVLKIEDMQELERLMSPAK